MTTPDQVREQFRALVAEADALTDAGDSDGANAEVAKLEALVSQQPNPLDILIPLTGSEEGPEVRFNAAAALLGLGAPDRGLQVLDQLAAEDSSVASVKAESVANYWRRQNA